MLLSSVCRINLRTAGLLCTLPTSTHRAEPLASIEGKGNGRYIYGVGVCSGLLERIRYYPRSSRMMLLNHRSISLCRPDAQRDYNLRLSLRTMLFGGLIYFDRMESTIADVV
jgi:hypothetical protein